MSKLKAKAVPKKSRSKAAVTRTPAKAGMIRARVDRKLKDDAERILAKAGLNASEAIRLFYRQIVLKKGLPFEVKIPNKETREAIEELRRGGGTEYRDTAELAEQLGF